MSKRTTSGLEWLSLSIASFNGSGYADKRTAQTYLASYIAYKEMKKDSYALEMLEEHFSEALVMSGKLIYANPPGHTPSKNGIKKFRKYYHG